MRQSTSKYFPTTVNGLLRALLKMYQDARDSLGNFSIACFFLAVVGSIPCQDCHYSAPSDRFSTANLTIIGWY